MPDFDFDAFNHDTPYEGEEGQPSAFTAESEPNTVAAPVAHTDTEAVAAVEPATEQPPLDNGSTEEVDKW